MPLRDALEDQPGVECLGLVGLLDQRPEGRGPMLRRLGGDRVVADDLVEAVVPQAPHLEERRIAGHGAIAHLPEQAENAVDMVVVDMADHDEIDDQRLMVIKIALVAQLHQPRPEVVVVRAAGSAVDQDQDRLVLGSAMDQEAVALVGRQEFETHRHAPSDRLAFRSIGWRAARRPCRGPGSSVPG